MSFSFSPSKRYIYEKYSAVPNIQSLSIYAFERYRAIENRLMNSFRYVDCEADNANTYSYEFASMLRDTGSVFASVMDKVVRIANKYDTKSEYGMGHYKEWLLANAPEIANVSIELYINRINRFLLPFEALTHKDAKLDWWTAFTALKHSDIDNFKQGNLRFVLLSLSALFTIITIALPYEQPEPKAEFMFNVGVRQPTHELAQSVFLR